MVGKEKNHIYCAYIRGDNLLKVGERVHSDIFKCYEKIKLKL